MGYLEEHDFADAPTIPEFYTGKTLLITGGSGFMGKVLIEKLLYSCPGLDRIYLLLRTKKGANPEDRLSSLFQSRCFDRLKEEIPGILESKVFCIAGDIKSVGMGLSQEDRTLLVNRVNIVFHVAASVRFNDSLTFATKLNLRGTREMVALAKELKQLIAFVHVSTCYSNTNRDPIEEEMYPPHADWRDTIHVCETLDEQLVNTLTPKYLGVIPNTYTFTKQLAEHVVYEQKGRLPMVIIRPSIVTSSYEEPFPGWLENFNGPVGMVIASGKGIMRSIYTDPNLIADYIPVDSAIRNFIAAGWIRGVKELKPSDDVLIFNSSASNLVHITSSELLVLGKQIAREQPLQGMLWDVGGTVTNSETLHYIKVLIYHLLPAMLVDLVLRACGRKPMLVTLQRRIYIANMALKYYATRQWTFANGRFLRLRELIKDADRDRFGYYLERLDRYEYLRRACAGSRNFLLNEPDSELPKARVHYWRMHYLAKVVKISFIVYVVWCAVHSRYANRLAGAGMAFFIQQP